MPKPTPFRSLTDHEPGGDELLSDAVDWDELLDARRPAATARAPAVAKIRLRHFCLRHANIRRIHIVGCARSGTTMLHYAMAAFANTILHDRETAVTRSPSMSRAVDLLLRNMGARERKYFVTKRNYYWFTRDNIEALIDRTLAENIFLIRIIRDPRDVLTSRHKTTEDRRYYVEPGRWLASIGAERYLFDRLPDYPDKITLRYEDVVGRPDDTERRLREAVGLNRRPGIHSWSTMKTNIESLDLTSTLEMGGALHDLRDFDPGTVGRWRGQSDSGEHVRYLLEKSEIRAPLRDFMAQNGYDADS